jgi:hypothetical protein
MPNVKFDYNCKETHLMAEAGKQLNPNIKWYYDERYLEKTYDLVIIGSCLQYFQNWEDELKKICRTVKNYLFLAGTPTIKNLPSIVMIERWYCEMLNQAINEDKLLKTIISVQLRIE